MTGKKFVSIDRFLPNFARTECIQPKHTSELGGMSTEAIGAVIEEIEEGVLIADANDPYLRLIHANRAFETITGFSRKEAIGKNCRYLQGSDRLQPEIARMREAITELKPVAVTLRNYRRDGRFFWNSIRLFPLPAPGNMTYIVGLIKDVTDLYLSAERIDRAEHYDQNSCFSAAFRLGVQNEPITSAVESTPHVRAPATIVNLIAVADIEP